MQGQKGSKEYTATITIRLSERLRDRVLAAAAIQELDASSLCRQLIARGLRDLEAARDTLSPYDLEAGRKGARAIKV